MRSQSRIPRRLHPVFVLAALVLALGAPSLRAADAQPAETVRSLAPDLSYWRIREVPGDLPPPGDRASLALVADVRFARATEDGATAFAAWLRSRARPATPVYVLLNAETAAELRARLDPRQLGPGVVTFAPAGSLASADIAVAVSALEDRAAYNALVPGKAITELVTDRLDKPRNDEAAITRKLTEKSVEPVPPQRGGRGGPNPADLRGGRGAGRGNGAPPPPALDLLLQRAVQVHQGIGALGRHR